MFLVPTALADWTFAAVRALCDAGQSESDRHDFKFYLPDVLNVTKICCAFANTFGGFIVIGVEDSGPRQFEPVGIDPDKELYGKFLDRMKATPDIVVSQPKLISVPGSTKLLYAFEIPQSSRRPHLPFSQDQRVFWKRQGSSCSQMTLEEIRYQMNTYEEKREKLALLLIDLGHKLKSLFADAHMPDGKYNGNMFSFDIIDRVVTEAYALLKGDPSIFGKLDTLRQRLLSVKAEKQKMLAILAREYGTNFKTAGAIKELRETAKRMLPEVNVLSEQIGRSLNGGLGIVNPYKGE